MIRCNEVARLLIEDQMRDHGFWMRLRVRVHSWMCGNCRRFERQIVQLGAAARRLMGSTEAEGPGRELEERILRALSTK